ncbi:hypothetical protein [Methylomicrobium album]|uniref:Uncharacterized protein n=1 Tax=Methylomicrobium album BG8 TaxID=686340 RepID=H8GKK9_METAL|nr:hypothetical protein [Methylomicrobium album]EIC28017.1 hypothetical protein Metal_0150 [Methylomicrobium album BG8]
MKFNVDREKFERAMKELKPTTKEERRRRLEEGYARGNREEPDNLGLDDELEYLEKLRNQ